jgi:hypothetical protein
MSLKDFKTRFDSQLAKPLNVSWSADLEARFQLQLPASE